MISRGLFSRVMNRKASSLIDFCSADRSTNPENVRTFEYPTQYLKFFLRSGSTFSIDIEKTKSKQDAFYDIIAELDEETCVINREDKIPNLKTADLCPDDLEIRLSKSDCKFRAVQDFKLVDEFMLAFIASDPVATIAPDKNNEHPGSTTVLLSDISLQKIEEAKQRLRAKPNPYDNR